MQCCLFWSGNYGHCTVISGTEEGRVRSGCALKDPSALWRCCCRRVAALRILSRVLDLSRAYPCSICRHTDCAPRSLPPHKLRRIMTRVTYVTNFGRRGTQRLHLGLGSRRVLRSGPALGWGNGLARWYEAANRAAGKGGIGRAFLRGLSCLLHLMSSAVIEDAREQIMS